MAMPMQQVEFEFPDPDKKKAGDVEVEIEGNETEFELEVEGAVGREQVGKKTPKGGVEIEIEDDTPVADRGRKPSKPPEEVTDEELESYSDKVKGRIKHLSKGYHDERRAKETALREREELERYTKQLVDENKTLKGSVDKSHNTLIESAQQQVKTELSSAKQKYKQAYEGGQSEEMVEAQAALNSAQIRADKVGNLKLREETTLQTPTNTEESRKATPTIQRDPQAIAWADNNSWFGADDEMTAFALGLHTKLTKEGTNPRSEEYYEKIDSRMRQIFPDHFDEGIEDEPAGRKKKSSNVVAPATRSTSPRKVTLSQTQVALAKRLGVSLEDYAKQAAVLMRKQD
jgi:hypothetical protein